jgi:hypothetical protein
MAQRSEAADAKRLAVLGDEIERWRRTRLRRRPMPAHLWEEAVRLARQLGVSPVKAALGLNYESLKERVGRSASASAAAPSMDFVEMSGAQLLATTGPVVEVVDGQGVRLAPGSALDVAEVVQAFRRREA